MGRVGIGIDIGTTKLCALAVDLQTGAVLDCLTAQNASLPGDAAGRRQSPARIWQAVQGFCHALETRHPGCAGIGVTCQMHGIVYVDARGEAVSDLYTWQDESAAAPMPGQAASCAEVLEQTTGYPVPPGYGAATYYAHVQTGNVPPGAAGICCIGDYVAMKLTGRARPLQHVSNAAGLGLFNRDTMSFDETAIQNAGLDPAFFPALTTAATTVGATAAGTPVCVCIGDNQASFAGAVAEPKDSVLINVGTGSQVSFLCGGGTPAAALEARPYLDGGLLLSGAALCGGSALALLERFYRDVLRMAGVAPPPELYEAMLRALPAPPPARQALQVDTRFAGTRAQPDLCGAITGIGLDNFSPASLTQGFLQGMAAELFELFSGATGGRVFTQLVAAGNGVRKNEPLQWLLAQTFGLPLRMPAHLEEAAYGAALFCAVCVGVHPTLEAAQAVIRAPFTP